MKKTINAFVLLLATFLLLGHYAKAQIMYTDINPDLNGMELTQTVLGKTFAWGLQGTWPYTVSPYNLNEQLVMVSALPDQIAIVDQGTMIGPNNLWSVDAFFGANPTAATDKYLGFRSGTVGNYRYGWFKIDVNPTTEVWTIKSFAYQNTPNTAIAAGDMGTGTGTVAVTAIAVNGQGGASTITTSGGTLQMVATITPANATNQMTTWAVQNGTGTATISATGLLTAQTNGTVTVRATAQDGSNVSGTKLITISGQQAVGIKEVDMLQSSCYPNPVQDDLTLHFAHEEVIQSIEITTITGQLVHKSTDIKKGKLITIPTTSLSEGIYILTFKNTAGKQGLQKFVKGK